MAYDPKLLGYQHILSWLETELPDISSYDDDEGLQAIAKSLEFVQEWLEAECDRLRG